MIFTTISAMLHILSHHSQNVFHLLHITEGSMYSVLRTAIHDPPGGGHKIVHFSVNWRNKLPNRGKNVLFHEEWGGSRSVCSIEQKTCTRNEVFSYEREFERDDEE